MMAGLDKQRLRIIKDNVNLKKASEKDDTQTKDYREAIMTKLMLQSELYSN